MRERSKKFALGTEEKEWVVFRARTLLYTRELIYKSGYLERGLVRLKMYRTLLGVTIGYVALNV